MMFPSVKRNLYVVVGTIALIVVYLNGAREIDFDHVPRSLSNDELAQGQTDASPRTQLNILTLGGSVTWGASLANRDDAFPFRLRDGHNHNVHNLAIRGTGSYYAAQCIYSMLVDEGVDPDTTFYDVIVFEFSINGMHGFQLLFNRLKERYPHAIMIYVDLFSLRAGQWDSTEARKVVEEGGGYVYQFPNKNDPTAPFDFRSITVHQEQQEEYPIEEIKGLFGGDKHHLSPDGHGLVTQKIVEIIERYGGLKEGSMFASPDPELGSWLGGDKCISWYADGEKPQMPSIIEGGEMNEWDADKNKWAIEVDADGMILQYFHDSDEDAPLELQHMTKCTDASSPWSSIYPPVIVRIEQDFSDIGIARLQAISGTVDIDRQDYEVVDSLEDGWTFISTLHRKHREFHVTSISNAGILKPGKNYIYIYPLRADDIKNESPFRLTATIICEACGRLGWNGDIW